MNIDFRSKKVIIITVISVILIGFIFALSFFLTTRLVPLKESNTSSDTNKISNDESAKSVMDSAFNAELKNKYPDAIKSYNDLISYYEKKPNKSASDDNQIAIIDSRLRAIDAHLEQAKKLKVAPEHNSEIPVGSGTPGEN